MSHARILVVEDENNLAETLQLNLSLENYSATVVQTGKEALDIINHQIAQYDLAILDVMLPDADGFELCRRIREKTENLPVLMLTALADKTSTVKGLRIGADDYLSKPFDLDELLLRVRNLLKRKPRTRSAQVFEFDNCQINFDTFEAVSANGAVHLLSKREAGLLKLLTQAAGNVVSREEIIEKLWEREENPSTRTIDNFILGFRKLFEKNPKEPAHFHTIRGVGYRFTP